MLRTDGTPFAMYDDGCENEDADGDDDEGARDGDGGWKVVLYEEPALEMKLGLIFLKTARASLRQRDPVGGNSRRGESRRGRLLAGRSR